MSISLHTLREKQSNAARGKSQGYVNNFLKLGARWFYNVSLTISKPLLRNLCQATTNVYLDYRPSKHH